MILPLFRLIASSRFLIADFFFSLNFFFYVVLNYESVFIFSLLRNVVWLYIFSFMMIHVDSILFKYLDRMKIDRMKIQRDIALVWDGVKT